MKQNNKNIDYQHIAESLLDDAIRLEIGMNGFSMFPVLQDGQKAQVQKLKAIDALPGDILVFKHRNNYIAHRLIRKKQTPNGIKLLAKGDNNKHYDPLFDEKELIGKVVSVQNGTHQKKQLQNKYALRKFAAMKFPNAYTTLNNLHFQLFQRHKLLKKHIEDAKNSYRLVTEKSEKLLIINSILSFLSGVLPFILLLCIKLFIDQLSLHSSENDELIAFWGILTATALVFFANGAVSEFRTYWGEKLSFSVLKRMYTNVQNMHFGLELSKFENSKELDKMQRVVQESTFRPVKFVNELLTLLKSVAAGIFLIGLFFSIKWYLAVILIIAIIPSSIIQLKFARKLYHLRNSQSHSERKMHYFNRILTGYPFAKELKLFHFNRFFKTKFKNKHQKLYLERISLRKNALKWNIGAQIFTVILIFASLSYVALLQISNTISIGELVLFVFAFQRGYSVLSDFFRSSTHIFEDLSYLKDLKNLLETKNQATEAKYSMEIKHSIAIENVSFKYETSKREALKNINTTINAGQTIAIVGTNGSGKSSFIKLLCGFYQPTTGTIKYDGKSTLELGQQAIAKNMAAVFQDFALYQVSALHNIALGNIHKPIDVKKVIEAAKIAGIHHELEQLPQGYDTILGNAFWGGEELSMGQWQKLAIARAIYRNADLLIMDEPSSALDVFAEKQIMNTVQTYANNKTTIIISHRLSTVQWADKILLFDDGSIVESGSHTELMQLKGSYFKLYNESKKLS